MENQPQQHNMLVVEPTIPLRVVVSLACLLSVIGSLLIISTYSFFKSLRTTPRLILVHLSIMDAGAATANLVGAVVDFNQYYYLTNQFRPNGYPLTSANVSDAVKITCVAQAAFAVYFTMGSFLWTLGMGLYLYIRVVHHNRINTKYVLYLVTIFCYGFPVLITLWKLLTDRLGYSPYSSEGWCGDQYIDLKTGYVSTLLHVISYNMWVFLIYILVPILYLSTYLHIRLEVKQTSMFIRRTQSQTGIWGAIQKLDYKLFAIPVAFLFLRVWSLVIDIMYVYANHHLAKTPHIVLTYLAGIGDSSQGFVNALLFILFTKKVRLKLIRCWCYCCLQPAFANPELLEDRYSSSTDASNTPPMLSGSDAGQVFPKSRCTGCLSQCYNC